MNIPFLPSPFPFPSSHGQGQEQDVPISLTREELAELVFQQRANLFDSYQDGPHLVAFNQDYSDMDLDYLQLASSLWTNCSFAATHMRFVSLGTAPLFRNCLLAGAILHGQLQGLRLEECVAVGARFVDAQLSQACILGSPFTLAPLIDASFVKAILVDALFTNINGQGANFTSADLTRAVFYANIAQYPSSPLLVPSDTYLSSRYDLPFFQEGVSDQGQQAGGVEDLEWSHYLLENHHIPSADHADIDLSRANFRQAVCHSTVFRNCQLSGADFTGADLTDADLRGANLQGMTLNHAILNGTRFSTVEQLARTEHFRIKQAVEVFCVHLRVPMIALYETMKQQQPIDRWIAQYFPDRGNDLSHEEGRIPYMQEMLFLRWLGNYDEHLHNGDNPPILLLLQWIQEMCHL